MNNQKIERGVLRNKISRTQDKDKKDRGTHLKKEKSNHLINREQSKREDKGRTSKGKPRTEANERNEQNEIRRGR